MPVRNFERGAVQILHLIAVSLAILLGLALSAQACAEAESHEAFGMRFWNALGQADFDKMKEYYAPEVILLAGSELLVKDYGINQDGDRGRDRVFKREELVAGYKALVKKVGTEKWKKALSAIGKDEISFTVADKADVTFKGVRKGDVIMKIAIGPGEYLFFILRRGEDKSWAIPMEKTDY